MAEEAGIRPMKWLGNMFLAAFLIAGFGSLSNMLVSFILWEPSYSHWPNVAGRLGIILGLYVVIRVFIEIHRGAK